MDYSVIHGHVSCQFINKC